MTIINATEAELAAVFEEWLRRYNEEPERFTDEYGEPEEYGAGCANYLIRLHGEITE